MRGINNNSLIDIKFEEYQAIIQAAEILSKAFKRKIYTASVNSQQEDKYTLFGVAFSFDNNLNG